jgi:hypothetical protein
MDTEKVRNGVVSPDRWDSGAYRTLVRWMA